MGTNVLLPQILRAITLHAREPGFFAPPAPSVVTLEPMAKAFELVLNGHDAAALSKPLSEALPCTLPPDAVRVCKGADSFAGLRVAVVAQWSATGEVAPYVVRTLRALKEQGYTVILVCGEEPKVRTGWLNLCAGLVWRTCSGYDFTSWKAVLQVFPSLYGAREVLLTNDSVFVPVRPLAPVHAAMDLLACDFWGLVESQEKQPHLQSYYLVFRQRALQHPAFAAFWQGVGTASRKLDVVLQHEVTLTPGLARQGLVPAAFVPAAVLPQGNVNPAHYFWRQLIERYGVPFIKRDILRLCRGHPWLTGWETVVQRGGYSTELVTEQLSGNVE